MDRKDLEGLTREELIARGTAAGLGRPRTMTNPELIEAIVSASARPGRPRGWLDRARDLLTSVIDLGIIGADGRGGKTDGRAREAGRAATAPPPLPTVTLAEIYAAQGHLERALVTLDEVLSKDPGSAEAIRLRSEYVEQIRRTKPSTPPAVIEARLETLQPPRVTAVEDGDPGIAAPGSDAPAEDDASLDALDAEDEIEEDFDEIVSLAVDPTTVYLYWEVRAQTLAAARAKNENGALVVRIVGVTPTARGPVTDVRDTRVDALSGELFVRGLPPSTEVRVSVGYKSRIPGAEGAAPTAVFEPFAVGIDLSTPRAAAAADVATEFRKWTDVSQAQAQAPAPTAGRTSSFTRTEAHDARVRFPAGVWVDPTTRVVRVTERDGRTAAAAEGGGEAIAPSKLASESHVRVPGSSEIFRRETVWSASSWSIASQMPQHSHLARQPSL